MALAALCKYWYQRTSSSNTVMGLPFWDWFIIALAAIFVIGFTAMVLDKGPGRH